MKIAATTIAALVATGLIVAPATAQAAERPLPTVCTGHALGLVNGVEETFAAGMDPTGRYTVGRNYDDYHTPMLWDRNKPIPLNLGGDDDWMTAVNQHGVAVGDGYGTGGWVYVNGKLHQVIGGSPVSINEKGQMVGGLNFWAAPLATPTTLPLPSGMTVGYTRDIDDNGTIVGQVGADEESYRTYVWTKDGRGHVLPEPTFEGAQLLAVRPTAVRGDWVVGYGYVGDDYSRPAAIRWNLSTNKVRVFTQMEDAYDVNAMGWFVGKGRTGHATMSDGRSFKKLPDVFPFASEVPWNVAYGISDDGLTMAGSVVEDKTYMNRAVKWRCF